MCGSVLSEFLGTGNDKDERFLNTIYLRENIACSNKIDLPHYIVEMLPKLCIQCRASGTSQTLGNSVKYYPKCLECKEKPDILRRKRKAVTEKDLSKRKK